MGTASAFGAIGGAIGGAKLAMMRFVYAIDTDDSFPEEDEDELTLRLAETFDWKFSETAELNQYATAEGGDDNTIVKAGVAVTSSLTGSLALRVGIDLTWTENPPVDGAGD